jgi:hypothetical protein
MSFTKESLERDESRRETSTGTQAVIVDDSNEVRGSCCSIYVGSKVNKNVNSHPRMTPFHQSNIL